MGQRSRTSGAGAPYSALGLDSCWFASLRLCPRPFAACRLLAMAVSYHSILRCAVSSEQFPAVCQRLPQLTTCQTEALSQTIIEVLLL